MQTHHAIFSALDTLINDLPSRTFQCAHEVSIRRPLPQDLLQRQMPMREHRLPLPRAFRRRNRVHLRYQRRRSITICPHTLRRATCSYDRVSGGGDIALLFAKTLLGDERGLLCSGVGSSGAERMCGLETTEGTVCSRRRRNLKISAALDCGDGGLLHRGVADRARHGSRTENSDVGSAWAELRS